MSQKRGRPQGSRNIRPGQREIENYFRLLTSAADAGDVNAAAALIELDERRNSDGNTRPTHENQSAQEGTHHE